MIFFRWFKGNRCDADAAVMEEDDDKEAGSWLPETTEPVEFMICLVSTLVL
jgi:hypothetical protein